MGGTGSGYGKHFTASELLSMLVVSESIINASFKALLRAKDVRPERYTILGERIDEKSCSRVSKGHDGD